MGKPVLYAYGCGSHHLTGTLRQQAMKYEKVAEIRDEMRERGDFENIEIPEHIQKLDLSHKTKIWRAEMDLVWEEFLRQNPKERTRETTKA